MPDRGPEEVLETAPHHRVVAPRQVDHGIASDYGTIYRTAVAQVAAGEVQGEPRDPPGGPRGMHEWTGLERTGQRHHFTQTPTDEPGRAGHQHARRTLWGHVAVAGAGGRQAAARGAGWGPARARRSSVASHHGSSSGVAMA